MVARLLMILGLAAALAGCAQGRSLPPLEEVSASPYRLDTGDELRLIVFGQPDLSGEFVINEAGRVSLPLVGAVPARGLSTVELEQAVIDELAGDLLVNPDVSVEIIQYRPFFILGEVERPGAYEYVPDMTVLTAVAIGGGFTFRAQEDFVSITRTAVRGEPVEARASRDAPVLPGDVIFVFERFF